MTFITLTAQCLVRDSVAVFCIGYILHPDPLQQISRFVVIFLLRFFKERILTFLIYMLLRAFIVSTRLENVFTAV